MELSCGPSWEPVLPQRGHCEGSSVLADPQPGVRAVVAVGWRPT